MPIGKPPASSPPPERGAAPVRPHGRPGRSRRAAKAIASVGGVLAFLSCCGGGPAFWLLKEPRILLFAVPALALGLLGLWATKPAQWSAIRRGLRLAPGVAELARRLGVPEEALRSFRPAYREARIPKRRGGHRILQVPDPGTMDLQRRILRRLLGRLRSHDAAYGFERGRSIAHNAAQHCGRAIVLRFDAVDFFPATRAARVERMFLRLGWNREAAALLTRLVTHDGGLPQGAPTSPRLSNLVNRGLDSELAGRIGRLRGRYTRYADDVTISFPEDWIGTPERAREIVRKSFAIRGYRLHGRKCSVRRRHQRQVVTGLVVNRRPALPRPLRRLLRAARHRVATGREATLTPAQLAGWAAFESMVRAQGAETPEPWVRRRRPWNRVRWRP